MKQSNKQKVEIHSRSLRGLNSRRRAWLVFMVACGVLLSGIAVLAVHAYSRGGARPRPAAGHSTGVVLPKPLSKADISQQGPASERVEVELITVTPDGILPKEISRPPGRFVIAVENRSGLREVALRLDQQGGNRLIDAPMSNGKLSLKHLIDYAPGVYLLTEANHADWICRVTIREK